jgi:ribosomal protein L29
MHFRHLCEIADLRRELDEVRAAYAELRAAVLAPQHAQDELVALHRERSIARTQAAECDPNAALN